MTTRPCYFIVDEHGTFWRLARRTFERIMLRHDDELHPEFKGKRVKYAELHVEYRGRRPIAVRRAFFRYLTFDETGRADQKQIAAYEQLLVEKFPLIEELEHPEVTARRAARADQKIERDFGWKPKHTLVDQLYEAVLNHQLVGGGRRH